MRKVFLKWLGKDCENGLTSGKEYVFHKSPISCEFVVNDSGVTLYTNGLESYWQRIERDCFERGGEIWFRHTPGDPMPCGGDTRIDILLPDGPSCLNPRIPSCVDWGSGVDGWGVIGWRFADSEQKQPVGDDWVSMPAGQAVIAREGVPCAAFDDDLSEPIFGIPVAIGWHQWRSTGVWIGKARTADEDESERNDLIAAVEDSTLTPAQRRHWEEMEAKQAAREQLKHDAEAKALKERADQLADAGRAMDRVNQDHSHKLGWRP